MALQRDARYPGRWTAASGGHPQGAFKNRTAPGALDGSYIEQDWANDWDGYFGSLLAAAGLTANGNVDAVGASQYFSALQTLFIASTPLSNPTTLRCSIPSASASATFTADTISLRTTLGGQTYSLSAFSKVINLATTGAGGMDTGTATASSWIAIYAIYNPTTQTSALLAQNAVNNVMPVIYGGANMPAGYTASCLISVLRTTAASLLDIAFQTDKYIGHQDRAAVNSGTIVGSLTNIVIAGNAPGNAKTVNFKGNIASSSANVTLSFAAAASTTGIANKSAGSTNSVGGAGFSTPLEGIPIITPQNISYSASVSAGTMTFILSTTGYTI